MTALSFQPELLAKVLAGTKTQTRRVVKPGEQLWAPRESRFNGGVFTAKKRAKWREGYTTAIVPGRGKHAVGRVLIKEIREDVNVRDIKWEDVLAEGFATKWEFLQTWITMHDKVAFKQWTPRYEYINDPGNYHPDFAPTFEKRMRRIVEDRPAELYHAWVITFELVKE
jgi:hypothetical protein